MNKALRLSERIYGVILHLYPLEHRRNYGKHMAQTFRDMGRAAFAEGGYLALAKLWTKTLADVVVSAAVEHMAAIRGQAAMSKKNVMIMALVLFFALVTGYVNLNATEVQPPMACLLAFSFLAGVLQPKAAWRWAILLALSVPLSYLIGVALHFPIAEPPEALAFDPRFLILIIPALVATYCGVLTRRTVWPVGTQPS